MADPELTASVRAAVERYDEAIERHKRVLAEARRERDAAIAEAIRAGMRQVDVAKASGYTRETIRAMMRAQGL